jgi:TonB family protein
MLIGGIDVFVISASRGTEPALSRGIISTTRQSGTESQIEITAPASAIDVGSPVLNKRGEVIGLLTLVDEGTKATLATRSSELLPLLRSQQVVSPSAITRPVALTFPRPQYTEKARSNKVSGTVAMRVLVGADGLVKQVQVIRGLPDGLTEEAVKSMQQMRFRPATRDGQPVQFWLVLEANFNLR